MKIALSIIGILVVAALVFQGWTIYISNVEEQQYTVTNTFDQIEIRHYPPALMASVEKERQAGVPSSNRNFGVLAGYIFGGNSEKQEFAMTAPVHMEEDETTATMSFVLPASAVEADLPTPNDPAVQLHWSEDEYVAAIQFSGFSSKESVAKHKAILVNTLEDQGIQYEDNFRILGYDPPFKMVDRRNEIIVRVDVSTLP